MSSAYRGIYGSTWHKPFNIRPKHWYQWFSPSFWRMKRTAEAYLNTVEVATAFERRIRDAVLYGYPL